MFYSLLKFRWVKDLQTCLKSCNIECTRQRATTKTFILCGVTLYCAQLGALENQLAESLRFLYPYAII